MGAQICYYYYYSKHIFDASPSPAAPMNKHIIVFDCETLHQCDLVQFFFSFLFFIVVHPPSFHPIPESFRSHSSNRTRRTDNIHVRTHPSDSISIAIPFQVQFNTYTDLTCAAAAACCRCYSGCRCSVGLHIEKWDETSDAVVSMVNFSSQFHSSDRVCELYAVFSSLASVYGVCPVPSVNTIAIISRHINVCEMNKELFMVFITFIVCIFFDMQKQFESDLDTFVQLKVYIFLIFFCFTSYGFFKFFFVAVLLFTVIVHVYTDGIVAVVVVVFVAEREFKFCSSVALKLFYEIILLLLLLSLWLFLHSADTGAQKWP